MVNMFRCPYCTYFAYEESYLGAHIYDIHQYQEFKKGNEKMVGEKSEKEKSKDQRISDDKELSYSVDTVLDERSKRYGEFYEHGRITQNLKTVMRDSRNWETLSPKMKEGLEMIAHKIGRILNGDANYKDSWTDIIGYARLIEKDLE